VRGIACLIVLIWHYFGATLASSPNQFIQSVFPLFCRIGPSGVDFFFVLSGFLIGGILLDNKQSPRYFLTFYVRRICRIFPVYYFIFAMLLLVLALRLNLAVPAFSDWLFKDLMPLWSYGTFTQNIFMSAQNNNGGAKFIGVNWSVAVEEQFYVIAPVVVLLFSRKNLIAICLAAIVIAPFIRQWVTAQGWWFYTLLPCRMDALAIGLLGACLMREPAALAFMKKNILVLYSILAAALLAFSLWWLTLFAYSAIAVFYATFIVLAVVHKDTNIAALCRLPWLGSIGMISYGIYMYHQPVSGIVHGVLFNQIPTLAKPSDLVAIVLSLVITMALSIASYYWMERPIRRLGHRVKWFDQVSLATARPKPEAP
jgi:peptidoglycan/LPS O-acetylase OafA/YrhL